MVGNLLESGLDLWQVLPYQKIKGLQGDTGTALELSCLGTRHPGRGSPGRRSR